MPYGCEPELAVDITNALTTTPTILTQALGKKVIIFYSTQFTALCNQSNLIYIALVHNKSYLNMQTTVGLDQMFYFWLSHRIYRDPMFLQELDLKFNSYIINCTSIVLMLIVDTDVGVDQGES